MRLKVPVRDISRSRGNKATRTPRGSVGGLIWLFVSLTLTGLVGLSGCSQSRIAGPSAGGLDGGGIPGADPVGSVPGADAGRATIRLDLRLDGHAADVAIPTTRAAVRASTPASVTVTLTSYDFGNVVIPWSRFTRSASADANGVVTLPVTVPSRTTLIEVAITGGSLGGFRAFRGVADLVPGPNRVLVQPVGSARPRDVAAELLVRITTNNTQFHRCTPGVAERLAAIAARVNRRQAVNLVYRDAILEVTDATLCGDLRSAGPETAPARIVSRGYAALSDLFSDNQQSAADRNANFISTIAADFRDLAGLPARAELSSTMLSRFTRYDINTYRFSLLDYTVADGGATIHARTRIEVNVVRKPGQPGAVVSFEGRVLLIDNSDPTVIWRRQPDGTWKMSGGLPFRSDEVGF